MHCELAKGTSGEQVGNKQGTSREQVRGRNKRTEYEDGIRGRNKSSE